MLTTKDFDEIVLDNPFLTDGTIGYGIQNNSWQFTINYNPDSLVLYGQDNSTCKYIILENDSNGFICKIIREDNYIKIIEWEKENNNSIGTCNETKENIDIVNEFKNLKKLVRVQIENYYSIIRNIQSYKFKFDFDATNTFLNYLEPLISFNQKEKIIKSLKRVERNPMKSFKNRIDTIDTDSKNIVHTIYFNALIKQLEKTDSLVIIDWNSTFEEIKEQFIPLFKMLNIPFRENINSDINDHNTTYYLKTIVNELLKYDYSTYDLNGNSDTYLLIFVKRNNEIEITEIARILKLEITTKN